MAYLDQLKQETEKLKTQEQAQQRLRAQQEQCFLTEVKPALERLRGYLQELCIHLNYVKPSIFVDFDLQGYGKLERWQQQEYRIVTPEQVKAEYQSYDRTKRAQREFSETNYNFSLRCQCLGRYKIRLEKHKVREMKWQREYFLKHRLPVSYQEEKDDKYNVISTVFVMEPLIPIEFEFKGKLATSNVELTVSNFPSISEKVYILSPAEITEKWLDELAKYLTRQPNQLELREPELFKKRALPPPTRDFLQFEVWLQQAQRELAEPLEMEPTKGSHQTEEIEQFDEWLQQQEAHLAKAAQTQVTTVDFKSSWSGLWKKISQFKRV